MRLGTASVKFTSYSSHLVSAWWKPTCSSPYFQNRTSKTTRDFKSTFFRIVFEVQRSGVVMDTAKMHMYRPEFYFVLSFFSYYEKKLNNQNLKSQVTMCVSNVKLWIITLFGFSLIYMGCLFCRLNISNKFKYWWKVSSHLSFLYILFPMSQKFF